MAMPKKCYDAALSTPIKNRDEDSLTVDSLQHFIPAQLEFDLEM